MTSYLLLRRGNQVRGTITMELFGHLYRTEERSPRVEGAQSKGWGLCWGWRQERREKQETPLPQPHAASSRDEHSFSN